MRRWRADSIGVISSRRASAICIRQRLRVPARPDERRRRVTSVAADSAAARYPHRHRRG
jgi:hypothetical protein